MQNLTVVYGKNYITELFGETTAICYVIQKDDQKLLNNGWGEHNSSLWGSRVSFCKVLIIRGIGYRASIIQNVKQNSDFDEQRYMLLRLGHSYYFYVKIPLFVNVNVIKKDRKIIIYGSHKDQILKFAKCLYQIRPTSVYTGRGIRYKNGNARRKLGKKDIRKGRFF